VDIFVPCRKRMPPRRWHWLDQLLEHHGDMLERVDDSRRIPWRCAGRCGEALASGCRTLRCEQPEGPDWVADVFARYHDNNDYGLHLMTF